MSKQETNRQLLNTWLDKLDVVDPFFGDPKRLEMLVNEAPNEQLKDWLSKQIEENQKFRSLLNV